MLNHNYKNKVAIITGGAGVLGGAIAKGRGSKGVRVAILGRTESYWVNVLLYITGMAIVQKLKQLMMPIVQHHGYHNI